MISQWRTTSIGALCDEGIADLQTGPFGSQLHASDYAPTGVPVVPTEAIQNRRIVHDALPRITSETAARLARHHLVPGDILFARRGVQATGKVAFVQEHERGFVCGTGAIRLRINRGEGILQAEYLSHLLSDKSATEWFKFHAIGATMPNLNEGIIRSFALKLPSWDEQIEIAEVLSAIAQRIELMRQMNETLEAMARAIFKSWFVDFYPMRAKAEGREPEGMDAATAALFPSEFQNSELGPIPVGWAVAHLGDIGHIVDCLHSKKPERVQVGKPFLQLCNISDDGTLDLSNSYYISDEDYQRWTSRLEASPGDCIITNVGRVGAVAQIPSGFRAALGRNMTGIRCCESYAFPTFLIEILTAPTMRNEIGLKTDSGTILESLNVRSIPLLRFVKPSVPIVERFENICRPFRARMESGLTQINTLVDLRDTLLPRLISGKLRVPEAEAILAEVG